MDSSLILKMFEGSIVGGSFVYLLSFITRNIASKQISNQKEIVACLSSFGEALHKMSDTLIRIDMHMEQLELRVRNLEK